MISIYIIITVYAAAAAALPKGSIECSFSESTGTRQCFGAVGQPLIFHLSDKANTMFSLIKDSKHRILKTTKNGTVIHEEYVNQHEHIRRGTFQLGVATKRHSGEYTLEEFWPDGKLLKKVSVHLEIQAPVVKPAVSQVCLSAEQMIISCSSEGDELQFILTLDGHSLLQTTDHNQSLTNWTAEISTVSKVTISLNEQLIGNLKCQVWNDVSRDETVFHLAACTDSVSTFPVATVAALARVLTVFFPVALSLVIITLHKKPRPTTVNESNSEAEVVYSHVEMLRTVGPEPNLTPRPNLHETAI